MQQAFDSFSFHLEEETSCPIRLKRILIIFSNIFFFVKTVRIILFFIKKISFLKILVDSIRQTKKKISNKYKSKNKYFKQFYFQVNTFSNNDTRTTRDN